MVQKGIKYFSAVQFTAEMKAVSMYDCLVAFEMKMHHL